MRIVSIDKKELKKYTIDPEMLQKAQRPCALILQLNYKNSRRDFAIPLRSNISPNTPKDQYFPLPPRPTTKNGYHHGVHYIKMFPINRSKANKFHTDDMYYKIIKAILDKNEKEIVSACQAYLNRYEAGDKPTYSTNIDLLIDMMNGNEVR